MKVLVTGMATAPEQALEEETAEETPNPLESEETEATHEP